MDWASSTLTPPTPWNSATSFILWSVGIEQSWNLLFQPHIVQELGEHLKMSKTVECSGFAWMERPTGTSAPQVWRMTRRVEDADGPIRCQSAATWWSLTRMEESSSVLERPLLESSLNMLTLLIADNTTFALEESLESMDVLLEQCSMLEVEME